VRKRSSTRRRDTRACVVTFVSVPFVRGRTMGCGGSVRHLPSWSLLHPSGLELTGRRRLLRGRQDGGGRPGAQNRHPGAGGGPVTGAAARAGLEHVQEVGGADGRGRGGAIGNEAVAAHVPEGGVVHQDGGVGPVGEWTAGGGVLRPGSRPPSSVGAVRRWF